MGFEFNPADEDEHGECGQEIKRLNAELTETRQALDESVRLQSHYASLLNQYDGGLRITFANSQEWIDRLRHVRSKVAKGVNP